MQRRVMTAAIMACLVLLALDCARPVVKPNWIDKGTAAFPGEEGKFIYGMGLSAYSPNEAAMRERSEHRSRLAIARSIKTYVASLTKDFMADYPDYFEKDAAGSDDYLERISKEVTDQVLMGCSVIDHWTDPASKTMYALARADKEQVDNMYKDRLRAMRGMLLQAKANEAMQQLDQQIQKVDTRNEAQWQKYFAPAPMPEGEPKQ